MLFIVNLYLLQIVEVKLYGPFAVVLRTVQKLSCALEAGKSCQWWEMNVNHTYDVAVFKLQWLEDAGETSSLQALYSQTARYRQRGVRT